jgi:hypothetical protein
VPDETANQAQAGAAASNSRIADHRIWLLYDFAYPADLDHGALLALSARSLATSRLAMVNSGRVGQPDADKPLFAAKSFRLGSDLHPAVVAAFGVRTTDWRHDRQVKCLQLTDRGRAVLNGDWVRPAGDPRAAAGYLPGRGLAIRRGPESRRRLSVASGAPPESVAERLQLSITDLWLVPFPTGVALAVLEIKLVARAITIADMEETLHAVSRVNRTSGGICWQCQAEPASLFTLADVVSEVLTPAKCAPETWNRVFIYVFTRFPAFPTSAGAVEELAWRLSRHYTSDYHPGSGYRDGMSLVRSFDDVVHTASIEGCATLAAGDQPFLIEGLAERVANVYLPLVLFAYHEHVQLLDLAQQIVDPQQRETVTGPQRLRELLDRFLRFRLVYRLPLVSDVTMHNLFHDALRGGLQHERLTRKIVEDVAEAERSLRRTELEAERRRAARRERTRLDSERAQHAAYFRRERRRAPILGVFAALLTFLTCFTAAKATWDALPLRNNYPEWELAPLGIGIFFAAVSLIVTWRRHHDEYRDSALEHGHAHHGETTDDELDAEREAEAVNTSAELLAARAPALPANVTGK